MRELSAAFALAGREAQASLRIAEREAAEPVRSTAERLAVSEISGVRRGRKRWQQMRVGTTRTLVYVAPVQRGVKTTGRNQLRRPKFADLLMDRAMQPALERNEARVDRAFERLFDRVADDFNRGGP
jgi:hypothetical protein